MKGLLGLVLFGVIAVLVLAYLASDDLSSVYSVTESRAVSADLSRTSAVIPKKKKAKEVAVCRQPAPLHGACVMACAGDRPCPAVPWNVTRQTVANTYVSLRYVPDSAQVSPNGTLSALLRLNRRDDRPLARDAFCATFQGIHVQVRGPTLHRAKLELSRDGKSIVALAEGLKPGSYTVLVERAMLRGYRIVANLTVLYARAASRRDSKRRICTPGELSGGIYRDGHWVKSDRGTSGMPLYHKAYFNGSEFAFKFQKNSGPVLTARIDSGLAAYTWQSKQCRIPSMKIREVTQCLRGKWVHFLGDSTTRSLHEDLRVMRSPGSYLRRNSHFGLVQFDSKVPMLNSFVWDPNLKWPSYAEFLNGLKIAKQASKYGHRLGAEKAKGVPDVLIIHSCYWAILNASGLPGYERTLVSLLEHLRKFKSLHPGVRLFWRSCYPQAFPTSTSPVFAYHSVEHRIFSNVSDVLTYIDAFSMMFQNPEISVDRVHYRGIGSFSVSNILYNIICANATL